MNGILNKLDVNSVLNYSIALAIVLGVKLISPIIARIIIGRSEERRVGKECM